MKAIRLTVLAMVILSSVQPAMARGLCDDVVLVMKQSTSGLSVYQDNQIQNGLCIMTKMVAEAVAADNSDAQEVCLEAAGYLMQEFKARFPDDDPQTVIGRC